MRLLLLTILLGCSLLQGCSPNDEAADPNPTPCGQATVISATQYANMVTYNYAFLNAQVNGDCLELTVGSSGCSGNSWTFKLIDANVLLESNPPQRLLRLKLTNPELCAAAFTKTVSFDLTGLRVAGTNKVKLQLDGWTGAPLEYQY